MSPQSTNAAIRLLHREENRLTHAFPERVDVVIVEVILREHVAERGWTPH